MQMQVLQPSHDMAATMTRYEKFLRAQSIQYAKQYKKILQGTTSFADYVSALFECSYFNFSQEIQRPQLEEIYSGSRNSDHKAGVVKI